MIRNHVFVAQGDLTELKADAIAFSTSWQLNGVGYLFSAFQTKVPGFDEQYAALGREAQVREAGQTWWLDLGAERVPRGVVVVISTDANLTAEELSRRAVTNSIDCAVRELRHTLPAPARLMIALPTFLAGTGGGRKRQVQLAKVQVQAAHAALARHANVDVAFVAYTAANYHLYLNARRELERERPELALPDEFEPPAELVRAVRSGECVLFVGSGLSRAADLPSWKTLIEVLARELELTATRDDLDYYLDLAEWHRERYKDEPDRLKQILYRHFGDTRRHSPTLAHFLLCAMPVRNLITTNYDDLLERTLGALRREHLLVLDDDQVPMTGRADSVCVVKLHGDARSGKHIVLSRDDYDGFFHRRPALALLLEGLLLNQTFLFVGYSLRDPNFRQIYNRIARMLHGAKRPAFATTTEIEATYSRTQWRNKQLELIPIRGPSDDPTPYLLRLLDRLSERVAGAPQVFLAPASEGDAPEVLHKLRGLLVQAAEEVADLCKLPAAQLSGAQVLIVAQALELLQRQGWRPPTRAGLSAMWRRLAERADPIDRPRLLAHAQAAADSLDELATIKKLRDHK